MSKEGVKIVVNRMVTDEEFRQKLFKDPETVIKSGGYDISEKELEAFKKLDAAELANLSPEELQERLSKIILVGLVV